MTTTTTTAAPPAGAVWVGDFDERFQDRMFVGVEVDLGALNCQLISVGFAGCQHRDGSSVTNVRVRFDAGDGPELTPGQARMLAWALMAAADQAEVVDGLAEGTSG